MKKWLLAAIATSALLAGCNDNSQSKEPEVPTIVEVDIQTPDKAPVETLTLKSKVTQGDKNIEDADVQFEFWESGMKDQGQMLNGEHKGDGVYEATVDVAHAGVYYMFAHTTAQGMHVMPKQEIIIGEPDMSKVLPEDDNQHDSMDMNMDEETK